MIVVADTGPINYLVLTGYIDVLETLYGQVVIPPEVQRELLDLRAPLAVRGWAGGLPPWCSVTRAPLIRASQLDDLDDGERAAIELALHLKAPYLLIDELDGRAAAEAMGLRIRGTLGIFQAAAGAGIIDLRQAVDRLLKTNFSASSELIQRVLRSDK